MSSSAPIAVPDRDLKARYPEVEKFGVLMRQELWANRGKGDQTVWQNTDPKQLTYDASWHLVKLMTALRSHDLYAIREHAADVANLAMMACDAAAGPLNTPFETTDNVGWAEGDRARFLGCTTEQVRWGSNADPKRDGVYMGAEGTVERVEVHSWHTKLWVRFSNGGDDALLGPYNSVCFDKVTRS